MIFAILFEDNDEFAHMRPKYMDQHLTFLKKNSAHIRAAGPMKEAASHIPAGGLWVVEADTLRGVQQLVEEDPFWPTGLRKHVKILEWTQVSNNRG